MQFSQALGTREFWVMFWQILSENNWGPVAPLPQAQMWAFSKALPCVGSHCLPWQIGGIKLDYLQGLFPNRNWMQAVLALQRWVLRKRQGFILFLKTAKESGNSFKRLTSKQKGNHPISPYLSHHVYSFGFTNAREKYVTKGIYISQTPPKHMPHYTYTNIEHADTLTLT